MDLTLLFNKSDFENPMVYEMLRAISVVKCGHPIMTQFSLMSLKSKRIANEYLNNYIKNTLNTVDWEQILQGDFNQLCQEEIFDDSFGEKRDYTNLFVRHTTTEPVLFIGNEETCTSACTLQNDE